ncbi:unnamed protein product [Timema podura]|uniref:Spliceosome-associated protein CWC27 homolog n=1 Tax=Timema podura TaxID=61482 RepID=A0ABN7NDJ3_TIMPD|nr:unnamed protein product [Timema podura]
MSNIYIQEPPTSGKVLLKTTVGDIDLELWSKEAPKACRNFIQLCLEGYYNGTIFHRVVKGFIVQGGDPTGTGTGGESIYGEPFKDEFHSRIRFNRRGLLAMANAGRNDNGSQFFFTLGATPELHNKHTIFGKVGGETIFNMIKLQEALVDQDERPLYPQKIIKTEVLFNPFPDIEPRGILKEAESNEENKKKKDKSGVKNFKLLSFGEEAEEDEEETIEANRKYSGRSKSTHDLLNDPKLSAVAAVESVGRKRSASSESDLSGDERSQTAEEKDEERMSRIKKKLKKGNNDDPKVRQAITAEESDGEYYLGKDRKDAELKKIDVTKEKTRGEENYDILSVKTNNLQYKLVLVSTKVVLLCETQRNVRFCFDGEREGVERRQGIRKEIQDLKREMHHGKKQKDEEKKEQEDAVKTKEMESGTLKAYKDEQEKYKALKTQVPKKGTTREAFTLSLLAKFKNKLATAKEKIQDSSDTEGRSAETRVDDDDDYNDDNWLTHTLRFESNTPVLAKDASTKNDDWFEITDPRNPINKRRREASRDGPKSKEKR